MRRLALVFLATACSPTMQAPEVTPEDIPSLESERLVRPRDPQLLTELGIAYYRAGDLPRAAALLDSTAWQTSDNFIAGLYLALAYEGLEDYAAARAIYDLLQQDEDLTGSERDEIADRLLGLGRLELHAEARRAVAGEAELSREAPLENTVAVFPWRYLGDDEELRPLERGLTHLVITDLSKVERLRLLERERVQVLVDELQLTESGRVDPRSGARSGRLLKAAAVVQGSLQESPVDAGQLRLDATVVHTESGVVTATGAADDALRHLFDLEKSVVLQLLAQLEIVLSPAEREAIEERPTADMQAFLAFSRGLVREDAGDYLGAAAEFEAAALQDGAFQAASVRRREAQRLALDARRSIDQFALDMRTATDRARRRSQTRAALLASVLRTNPSRGGRIERRTRLGVPDKRRGLQEVLLRDDPRDLDGAGDVVIVVPRP